MAVLNYRDPGTGEWVVLEGATGPTGPSGPTGPMGPGSNEVTIQTDAPPTNTGLELWIDADADPAAGSGYLTVAEANIRYVQATGDTMIGNLSLLDDPVLPNEAVTKQYVDDRIAEGGGGPEEVAIQSGEPAEHPDLWVDLDAGSGAFARMEESIRGIEQTIAALDARLRAVEERLG